MPGKSNMIPAQMLEQILEISKEHLQAARNDQWDAWETLAAEKRRLYERLERAAGQSPDVEEFRLVDEIRFLEAQTLDVLKAKREDTLRELSRVRGSRKAAAYRDAGRFAGQRGHFGIAC